MSQQEFKLSYGQQHEQLTATILAAILPKDRPITLESPDDVKEFDEWYVPNVNAAARLADLVIHQAHTARGDAEHLSPARYEREPRAIRFV